MAYSRILRSSGLDSDAELVKHIKENYIHRVHQAVQVSNANSVPYAVSIICSEIVNHCVLLM